MPRHAHFRSFGRRRVELQAALNAPEMQWKGTVRMVDLGLGGARVLSPAPLSIGTAVSLAIELPDRWDPIRLEAYVVWAAGGKPAAAGLEFADPEGSTLRALLDLLGDG